MNVLELFMVWSHCHFGVVLYLVGFRECTKRGPGVAVLLYNVFNEMSPARDYVFGEQLRSGVTK